MTAKNKPSPRGTTLNEPPAAYGGEIVLYQAPDGSVKLDVRLGKETIWLSLNQMAALFERDKSVISRHLRNVYKEGELEREATVAFFATVQDEGGRQGARQGEYYNPVPGRRGYPSRLTSNVPDNGGESTRGCKNNNRRQANGL